MRTVGDVLLFVATSLVFSVTILSTVIQILARDQDSRSFLYILVPLTLQVGIVTLSSYLARIFPPAVLQSNPHESFPLLLAIASIVLISVILYSVSHYIMRIAGDYIVKRFRGIGNWVLVDEVLILAPYALLLFASFFVAWRGEHALGLHEFSLGEYLVFQTRQFLLPVTPILIFIFVSDLLTSGSRAVKARVPR